MFKSILKIIFLFLIFASSAANAQFIGYGFSVSTNGFYTTGAKLFLNPNAGDPFIRDQYMPIEHIFSYGAEIRYGILDEIILGLNFEITRATSSGQNVAVSTPSGVKLLLVEDGFEMMPVELTVYYLLPFSTDEFKFYMAGGAGFYFGRHIRRFGDAEVETIDLNSTPGLHVAVSIEYMIFDYFSVRAGMKFRDPEFTMENKYLNTTIHFENQEISVIKDTFITKANADGIVFMLGAAVHF